MQQDAEGALTCCLLMHAEQAVMRDLSCVCRFI